MNTDGIVIRVVKTGESDRFVKILTRDRGVVSAFAKSADRAKSKLQTATSLFAYCNFSLFPGREHYSVDEAEIITVFYGLRDSIEALTLGQYFCEIASLMSPENSADEAQLRLILNSLRFLETGEKDREMLKAVYELRSASSGGYMPDLVGCSGCGAFESDTMYFDAGDGTLYCSSCGQTRGLRALPLSVVRAMRHIVFSPFEKIWSFTLPPEETALLSSVTELYLENGLGRRSRLLDFYRSL